MYSILIHSRSKSVGSSLYIDIALLPALLRGGGVACTGYEARSWHEYSPETNHKL